MLNELNLVDLNKFKEQLAKLKERFKIGLTDELTDENDELFELFLEKRCLVCKLIDFIERWFTELFETVLNKICLKQIDFVELIPELNKHRKLFIYLKISIGRERERERVNEKSEEKEKQKKYRLF